MKSFRNTLVMLLLMGTIVVFLGAFNRPNKPPHDFRIVGYLYNKKVNMDKIPYRYLTVINYSFALPAPDSSGNVMPVPFPDQLRKLTTDAHAHGVKVFICIGGWAIGDGGGNDTRFEVLANSQKTRTRFTESAMNIVRKFNLDGVDIDWEYPDPIEPSSSDYAALMKQLSDSLHAAGKKLSAAIVAFKDLHGFGVKKEVFSYVDWMNIMAYDYKDDENMPHSPYWLALRSMEYWLGRGLPKDKAVLGLNFGFYRFLIAHGANPYADSYIVKQGFRRFRDSSAPPKPDTVYYNGITTVKEKTMLAMKKGSGIMMWAITGDTTGKYSLLKAIHEVVTGKDSNNGN